MSWGTRTTMVLAVALASASCQALVGLDDYAGTGAQSAGGNGGSGGVTTPVSTSNATGGQGGAGGGVGGMGGDGGGCQTADTSTMCNLANDCLSTCTDEMFSCDGTGCNTTLKCSVDLGQLEVLDAKYDDGTTYVLLLDRAGAEMFLRTYSDTCVATSYLPVIFNAPPNDFLQAKIDIAGGFAYVGWRANIRPTNGGAATNCRLGSWNTSDSALVPAVAPEGLPCVATTLKGFTVTQQAGETLAYFLANADGGPAIHRMLGSMEDGSDAVWRESFQYTPNAVLHGLVEIDGPKAALVVVGTSDNCPAIERRRVSSGVFGAWEPLSNFSTDTACTFMLRSGLDDTVSPPPLPSDHYATSWLAPPTEVQLQWPNYSPDLRLARVNQNRFAIATLHADRVDLGRFSHTVASPDGTRRAFAELHMQGANDRMHLSASFGATWFLGLQKNQVSVVDPTVMTPTPMVGPHSFLSPFAIGLSDKLAPRDSLTLPAATSANASLNGLVSTELGDPADTDVVLFWGETKNGALGIGPDMIPANRTFLQLHYFARQP